MPEVHASTLPPAYLLSDRSSSSRRPRVAASASIRSSAWPNAARSKLSPCLRVVAEFLSKTRIQNPPHKAGYECPPTCPSGRSEAAVRLLSPASRTAVHLPGGVGFSWENACCVSHQSKAAKAPKGSGGSRTAASHWRFPCARQVRYLVARADGADGQPHGRVRCAMPAVQPPAQACQPQEARAPCLA